jgi:hypothetical protein
MPADRQPLLHHHAAAGTGLTRGDRVHRDDPLPGAYWLESEDAHDCVPSGVLDRLGELVMLEQVGDRQVFMIDHVKGARGGARLCAESPDAGASPAGALSPAT